MKYSFVDLFSGCGGMSYGFTKSDFIPIGAADLEVAKPSMGIGATECNRTYEKNIGLSPLNVDLHEITPDDLASHFGFGKNDVDVLISCAPCTGFSQKSSRNHIVDDKRNTLVHRSTIFLKCYMPAFFVMENVKELVKGRHSHHFEMLYKVLVELGYKIYVDVHELADYGLPQYRKRTLIVASRVGSPDLELPTVNKHKTVGDTIRHLSRLRAGSTSSRDKMHTAPNCTGVSLERMKAIPKNGGSWIDIPEEKEHLLIPSMRRDKPGSFPDVYGRLSWDKPAPTITRECGHPGNGRYSHPSQNRLISVREMSLLQGFPDSYEFVGQIGSRYRQIGDAVPPLISYAIAQQLADKLSGKWKASERLQVSVF